MAAGTLPAIAGHDITVTANGPFDRAYFDCSCGRTATRASKKAANVSALLHYVDVSTDRVACSKAQQMIHDRVQTVTSSCG